ncbi:MAG: hypothetical protein ACK52I_08100 [Pseudomonadota bacterium]|jgi:hypothetical protein
MQIFIPTYGRSGEQATLSNLLPTGRKVTLVVQEREASKYLAHSVLESVSVQVLPPEIQTISATRDYILKHATDDSILMLDDDLDFAVRRTDDPTRFRSPETEDIKRMLNEVEELLTTSPFVSIGAREGGNRNVEPYLYNTRMMRALGYRRDYLNAWKITFAPMELMEDFHVALQIMLVGGTCVVANKWVTNQRSGSGAKGGCSSYRTLEMHGDAARQLAALYPEYVTVVHKQTKTAWGGQPRLDVRVAWKKAAAAGKASREKRRTGVLDQ